MNFRACFFELSKFKKRTPGEYVKVPVYKFSGQSVDHRLRKDCPFDIRFSGVELPLDPMYQNTVKIGFG